MVAGEAGVGKTRLINTYIDEAGNDGAVILMGGCIPLRDGRAAVRPVVEALRGFVHRATPDELETVLGHGRSELARLVPALGPVAEGAGFRGG